MKEVIHDMREFAERNRAEHVHYTLRVSWSPPPVAVFRVYGWTLDALDEKVVLILEVSENPVEIASKYPDAKDANEAVLAWCSALQQKLGALLKENRTLSPGRWEE